MKAQILCLLIALLMMACNQNPETSSNQMAMEMSELPPQPAELVHFVPPVVKDDAMDETVLNSSGTNRQSEKRKKIIKDGNISIKVQEVEKARKRIDELVSKFDAYYEREDFSNNDVIISYDLKIRIPGKYFETFLRFSEKGVGEMVSKDVNARDVTEEYMDEETRLNSKRIFRDRYYSLLKDADKIPDILSIEENIRVLQEEIESKEGRLRFLDDQITYSTLNVNLFLRKKPANTPPAESFGQKVKLSIVNGWNSVIAFVLWFIKNWPWILVSVIAFAGLTKVWKRRKKISANEKALE